jgi:hypothetical protein
MKFLLVIIMLTATLTLRLIPDTDIKQAHVPPLISAIVDIPAYSNKYIFVILGICLNGINMLNQT